MSLSGRAEQVTNRCERRFTRSRLKLALLSGPASRVGHDRLLSAKRDPVAEGAAEFSAATSHRLQPLTIRPTNPPPVVGSFSPRNGHLPSFQQRRHAAG